MKSCKECGEIKPLDDFYLDGTGTTRRRLECKACHREMKREWRALNLERASQVSRRSDLRRHYGITIEQYERMLEHQGTVCAICGGVDRRHRLAVDHDERTGAIRSLLCMNCNRGIGMLAHDPHLLEVAAEYMRSYS